jgi:hypothetical protein
MLAKLKIAVLIKEAIKLASFRIVSTKTVSGASAFVSLITGSKCPETKYFLLKLVSLFLF